MSFTSFIFSLITTLLHYNQFQMDTIKSWPTFFILVQYPVSFRSKMGCKCSFMFTLNSKSIAIQSQIVSHVVGTVGIWKVQEFRHVHLFISSDLSDWHCVDSGHAPSVWCHPSCDLACRERERHSAWRGSDHWPLVVSVCLCGDCLCLCVCDQDNSAQCKSSAAQIFIVLSHKPIRAKNSLMQP